MSLCYIFIEHLNPAVLVWPPKAEPIWRDIAFCVLLQDKSQTQKHRHTLSVFWLLLVRPCSTHVAMVTGPDSSMRKRPPPLCEVGQKQFLKCARSTLEL